MAKEPLGDDTSPAGGPEGGGSDLSPPAVPPALYDEHYYLNWCAGFEAWRESDGAEFAPLYVGSLDLAELQPGEALVDIGTGRGELLVTAVQRGAARAVGIEYSPDAVELATRTIRTHGASPAAEVVLADARSLPLPANQADLVTMLDVVEHLSPSELDRALLEARRVLKPGGPHLHPHDAESADLHGDVPPSTNAGPMAVSVLAEGPSGPPGARDARE